MGDLQWYDFWRLVNLALCLSCIFVLLARYKRNSWSWNIKTTDYWYAFVVWTFTGAVSSIEGIWQNGDLGVRVLCVFAGGLVTLKALRRKGAWGENSVGTAN